MGKKARFLGSRPIRAGPWSCRASCSTQGTVTLNGLAAPDGTALAHAIAQQGRDVQSQEGVRQPEAFGMACSRITSFDTGSNGRKQRFAIGTAGFEPVISLPSLAFPRPFRSPKIE